MNHTTPSPRQQRSAVLVLTHADGHVECYAERGVTIHLTRVPAAFTPDGERQAEDVAEWLLPRRYRELWRADYLRANGTTRPLLPSTLAEAHTVTAIIDALNQATDSFAPTEESEAVAWTL